MFTFLVQPETAPFTIALLVMLLLGIVEAFGLGGAALGSDVHAETGDFGDAAASGLDWLNIGRLPLLMVLVVLLTCFGLAGLVAQLVALRLGGLMPLAAAVPLALGVALPLNRLLGAGLARVLPHDETTAVSVDSLVGRRARIVIGTARRGSPARARVEDAFGQAHYVMVEPVDDIALTDAAILLLTRRDGELFQAIEIEPDVFFQLRPTR